MSQARHSRACKRRLERQTPDTYRRPEQSPQQGPAQVVRLRFFGMDTHVQHTTTSCYMGRVTDKRLHSYTNIQVAMRKEVTRVTMYVSPTCGSMRTTAQSFARLSMRMTISRFTAASHRPAAPGMQTKHNLSQVGHMRSSRV